MAASDLKTMMRRLYDEVFNQGKLDVIDEVVAPDIIDHEEFPDATATGIEGLRQTVRIMREAFPDLHFTVEDMIAEGDRVATRVTMTGTHSGEFFGIPATGKSIEISIMEIVRFENGKAVEHWGMPDNLGMLQQLGAIPAPDQAPV